MLTIRSHASWRPLPGPPLPYSRAGALVVLLVSGVTFLTVGSRSPAPEPLEQRTARDVSAHFDLPDGFEVTLWAESPLFFNPTNMDVDELGRVWVTEAVNYRTFKDRQGYRQHAPGDRVVILEDADGDGQADVSSVFAQQEPVHAPLGIAVLGNRVVISSSPSLLVLADEDGDGFADDLDTLLTGFGGFDHDHGLHALTIGPDGRWYFNVGNAGPHLVTDRSGWTLRSGSLYNGGTPYNNSNRGGLVSDDGRIWTGGLALRMNPDGTGLEVLAHNFRNAYELAVDSYGHLWQNDNDDEVQACRTTWLMEGANAGFFSSDGMRTWQADRRPGQSTFAAHWHQDDPGVIPAGDMVGAGSPTGIVVNEGDGLGVDYRGVIFSADAGRNVIFGYRPVPEGSGFRMERFSFMSSVPDPSEDYVWNDEAHFEDRRKWFRPSDVAVGPDGALYIADWYDPIVGGHEMHDREGHGRIYRVAPRDSSLRVPEIDLTSSEGQIRALLSPAVNVRSAGRKKLVERGEEAIPDVLPLLASENNYHRARAIWILPHLSGAGVRAAEEVLRSHQIDPDLRVTAIRSLRAFAGDIAPYLPDLVEDPSPAVRREAALALLDLPIERRMQYLLPLSRGVDGEDRWYLEAVGTAASGLEEELWDAVSSEEDGSPDSWSPRLEALAWRLHPASALDDFAVRARAEGLAMRERHRALTAIGFVEDVRAAEIMHELAASPHGEVAEAAGWWLRYRSSNTWSKYTASQISPGAADPVWRIQDDERSLFARMTDEGLPIRERVDAAFDLASGPAGAAFVLAKQDEMNIPYQIAGALGSAFRTNPDPLVRTLAGVGDTSDAISEPSVLGLRGDADAGQGTFYTACASCHALAGGGADVGPALGSIGSKFDRRGLVNAIVRPSDALQHGYEPHLVVTTDGEIFAGFLLGEGVTLVLKAPTGQQHAIDADRVETRRRVAVSLMPPPERLQLSAQDVADVVDFLLQQR